MTTETDAIRWATGLGLPVLTAAILFLANWLRAVSKQSNDSAVEVAKLRAHMAENYVRGHEVDRVSQAVETLRADLTTKVDNLLIAVHQLIGQQSR